MVDLIAEFSNRPIIFAHRGASGYEHENTFPAFDKAIELGADGLETDVWLLGDGEVVCYHDKAIMFPGATEQSNISQLTLAQIKSITFDNQAKIPTFREFLMRYAPQKTKAGHPLLFSIDLQDLKVWQAVIPLLYEFNVVDRTFLCGTTTMIFKKIRQQDTNVLLVASNQQELIKPENFQPNGKVTPLNLTAFNIQVDNFRPVYAEILRKVGLKVFIWDMHTEESLRTFLELCPDAIYSNFPDKAIKMRNELCKN